MNAREAITKELKEAKKNLKQYQQILTDCDDKGAERYLILTATWQLIGHYTRKIDELSQQLDELAEQNHTLSM